MTHPECLRFLIIPCFRVHTFQVSIIRLEPRTERVRFQLPARVAEMLWSKHIECSPRARSWCPLSSCLRAARLRGPRWVWFAQRLERSRVPLARCVAVLCSGVSLSSNVGDIHFDLFARTFAPTVCLLLCVASFD